MLHQHGLYDFPETILLYETLRTLKKSCLIILSEKNSYFINDTILENIVL